MRTQKWKSRGSCLLNPVLLPDFCIEGQGSGGGKLRNRENSVHNGIETPYAQEWGVAEIGGGRKRISQLTL